MRTETADLDPQVLEQRIIGEPFRSRKNRVFRVRWDGGEAVAKVYAPERRHLAEQEFEILTRCRGLGIAAPRPIALGAGVIIMDYIVAENLSDLFDKMLEDGGSDGTRELMTDGVARWLAQFHKLMGGTARGDSVLRNFLVTHGTILGLDFEESGERDPLTDLGDVAANMLGMRPTFARERFDLVQELASSYWRHSGTDRSGDFPGFVAQALEHYAPFRPDGETMSSWARRLRREGFPS